MSRYLPDLKPTPFQNEFILSPKTEAILSGPCGCGKTTALLYAALLYADAPNFRGVIFTRKLMDQMLPHSIYQRCHEWFQSFIDSGEVHYEKTERCFYFKEGGRLRFSHMSQPYDMNRHSSSEYSFVGFEQVNYFEQAMYLHMFCRLRGSKGEPLQIRSVGNLTDKYCPQWLKERFSEKNLLETERHLVSQHPALV